MKFKTFLLMLLVSFAFANCSKDDDNNGNDTNDTNEDLNESNVTAVIMDGEQTVQFSSENENSFATIVKTKVNEDEIEQLVIIMKDDNSEVLIVASATPAPNNPIDYNLSLPLTEEYLFTAGVSMDGENSSSDKTYGVGTYQHEEEVVHQSKGSFKITSISTTSVEGTFEMTLYNSYDPNTAQDAKELSVTEGAFDLPIVELSEEDLEYLGLD